MISAAVGETARGMPSASDTYAADLIAEADGEDCCSFFFCVSINNTRM